MPSSPPKGNGNGRSQLPPLKADGPNRGRKMRPGCEKAGTPTPTTRAGKTDWSPRAPSPNRVRKTEPRDLIETRKELMTEKKG